MKRQSNSLCFIFRHTLLSAVIGSMLSCQSHPERLNVKANMEVYQKPWQRAVSISPSLNGDVNFLAYNEKGIQILQKQTSQTELLSIFRDKENIILEIWYQENDQWFTDRIIYPQTSKIVDYISVRLKGTFQIAKIEISQDKGSELLVLDSLTFLTKGTENAITPLLLNQQSQLVYCESSKTRSLRKIDLESGENSVLVKNAYSPQKLSKSNKIIFISEWEPQQSFHTVSVDDSKVLIASQAEILEALAASRNSTVSALYSLKLIDRRQKEKINTASLDNLLKSVCLNSPAVISARHNAEAALYRYLQTKKNRNWNIYLRGVYTADNKILFDNANTAPGDVSSITDFLRLTTGISYTVIPNENYRNSLSDFHNWQYEIEIQNLYQVLNEKLISTLQSLADIQNCEQRTIILDKIIDHCSRKLAVLEKGDPGINAVQDLKSYFTDIKLIHEKDRRLTAGKHLYSLDVIRHNLGLNSNPEFVLKNLPKINTAGDLKNIDLLKSRSHLNNPFIRKAYLNILTAAAEKDMGHPSTRKDLLNIDLNYGIGIHHWQRIIDDFLNLSSSFNYSPDDKKKQKLYEMEWHNKILAFQNLLEETSGKTDVVLNDYHRKILMLKSLKDDFSKSNLFYLDNMRKKRAVEVTGYTHNQLGKNANQLQVEYMKGKLQELDAEKNYFDFQIGLLENLQDFNSIYSWFNTYSAKTPSYLLRIGFGNSSFQEMKKIVNTVEPNNTVLVEVSTQWIKGKSLEIDWILKQLTFKNSDIILTLRNDGILLEQIAVIEASQIINRFVINSFALVSNDREKASVTDSQIYQNFQKKFIRKIKIYVGPDKKNAWQKSSLKNTEIYLLKDDKKEILSSVKLTAPNQNSDSMETEINETKK